MKQSNPAQPVAAQPAPLQPAQLRWAGDTPEAEHFGDIYFSRENGLAESRYVFLNGNQLHARWQQLPAHATFVIGETGFGTGLNFLLAWQLWQQTAAPHAQLFFISTELHPLTLDDLQRALACWPELAPQAAKLLQEYPSLTPGFHWLRFVDDRVTLLLLLGDANDTLPQLADSQHPQFTQHNPWSVDAWFLDGFAPAKNPQLWQQHLLAQIAALSKPGTTLASFTAAGQVRRDLAASGFTVAKIPGYGSKREMITAQFTEQISANITKPETPWLLHAKPHSTPQHVAVIGAGLAGCHIARALAARGVRVTLLEQHAKPAQEASGNPQGALHTKLSANPAALARFSLTSFQYAVRHFRQQHLQPCLQSCGLLQLDDAPTDAQQAFFQTTPELLQWLNAESASEKSGITLERGGWWLPQAGWANPQQICTQLLDHPNITVHYGAHIQTLQRDNRVLHAMDAHGNIIASAEHWVIACANQTAAFTETAWLPLRAVRGQITLLPATASSKKLQCVVCDEGYFTPAHATDSHNDAHCLGASFVPNDTSTALRTSEHQHNLALLADISKTLRSEWTDATPMQGRAALRSTTPDHLPMVGALPDREAFVRHYAALKHNAKTVIAETGHGAEGLWLFTGFGGRGLCYIPLAAELLCSQLLHQPRPVPRNIQMALSPARFVMRDLIRTNKQH